LRQPLGHETGSLDRNILPLLGRERPYVAYNELFLAPSPLRASPLARFRQWQLRRDFDAIWDNLNARFRDAGADQQLADELRNRDDSVASVPVNEAMARASVGQKRDAAAGHAAHGQSQRREPGKRLPPAVVGVKNLNGLGKQLGPQLEDAVSLSGIVPRQGENAQVLLASLRLERAPFRADYELRVSPLSEPSRQEQQLPLPPTKLAAGVEMDDT